MTHLDNTARIPSTPRAEHGRTGPVLIDPRNFKFVAGGSPKGGWMEPVSRQARTGTESPKGGW